MKRVYLTKYDYEQIDPTLAGWAKINSYKDTEPTPCPDFLGSRTREEWLGAYSELRARVLAHGKTAHVVSEWDSHWDAKFCPQGGHFDRKYLEESYARSYEFAERTITEGDLAIGRDFLLRLVKQVVSRVGYPQFNWDVIEFGGESTNSGLPYLVQKRSYLAETHGNIGWRHVFPNIPGQRYQRGKRRCINMDSVDNVRYLSAVLDGVRYWLRENLPEYFSAWRNPSMYVHPTLTDRVSRNYAFVETDFDHCDECYGADLVDFAVLPIFEVLIPNEMEFMRFAAAVEELWQQPIYMGAYCLEGKHNALSGQNVVSDFETIYDVELSLTGCLMSGLRYDSYDIFALGDDITVALRGSVKRAEEVFEVMQATATSNGHIMNRDKCYVGKGSARFLKRLYTPGLPLEYNFMGQAYMPGAYPGSLALNSIVNPERFARTRADGIVATVQRCDNLYGSPVWSEFALLVFSSIRRTLGAQVLAEQLASGQPERDWWARLYGDSWNLNDSRTYRLLLRNNLVK